MLSPQSCKGYLIFYWTKIICNVSIYSLTDFVLLLHIKVFFVRERVVWRDDSVSKELAESRWGPEFKFPAGLWKARCGSLHLHSCCWGGRDRQIPRRWLTSQSGLPGKLRVQWESLPHKARWITMEGGTLHQPPAFICTHIQEHPHIHIHMRVHSHIDTKGKICINRIQNHTKACQCAEKVPRGTLS